MTYEKEGSGSRIARNARDLVAAAGNRAEQFARVGRLQLDLLGIRREMQKELAELGTRTLERVRRGDRAPIEDDPLTEQIVRRVLELESERMAREAEIDRIRSSVSTGGFEDRASGREGGSF
ncbi:MAG: hypothetical protein ACE15D_06595 [Candidatus Eisenbacteria bacterium]